MWMMSFHGLSYSGLATLTLMWMNLPGGKIYPCGGEGHSWGKMHPTPLRTLGSSTWIPQPVLRGRMFGVSLAFHQFQDSPSPHSPAQFLCLELHPSSSLSPETTPQANSGQDQGRARRGHQIHWVVHPGCGKMIHMMIWGPQDISPLPNMGDHIGRESTIINVPRLVKCHPLWMGVEQYSRGERLRLGGMTDLASFQLCNLG